MFSRHSKVGIFTLALAAASIAAVPPSWHRIPPWPATATGIMAVAVIWPGGTIVIIRIAITMVVAMAITAAITSRPS